MRTLLASVMKHQKEYARLPFFVYLQNDAISPWQRLAFYPCMAHFILNFGDLNRYVLRQEPTQDSYQALINAHSRAEDHRWHRYLEDYAKLGYDLPQRPTELMRFLWSEETAFNRTLMYRLTGLISHANSRQKLAILEAIELTWNVLFGELSRLANQIGQITGVELRYGEDVHRDREVGQLLSADPRLLAEVALTDSEREETLRQVAEVFSAFEAWTCGLLEYAMTHRAAVQLRPPTLVRHERYAGASAA